MNTLRLQQVIKISQKINPIFFNDLYFYHPSPLFWHEQTDWLEIMNYINDLQNKKWPIEKPWKFRLFCFACDTESPKVEINQLMESVK